jgi:VWFA-related protein
MRASAGLGALQDFTTDKAMLRAAADQIRWYPSGRGELSAYRALGADPTSDIQEFNAVPGGAFQYQEVENYRETVFTVGVLDSLRRVVHAMAPLPGRKSVIVLSDRLPAAVREITDGPMEARTTTRVDGSGPILNRMRLCIDQAARSGVVIDAIDTRGLASLAISAADESRMIHKIGVAQQVEGGELAMKERHEIHDQDQAGGWYLASETGGLMIPEANDIGAGIARIYADMNSYYVLGFHPPEEAFERSPDGRPIFRRITVKVKREGLQVRSRSGFFGMADEETAPRPQRAELALESSLDSPFGSSAVNLQLRSSFVSARKNQWLARTSLWVDARDLTLEGPTYNRSGIIHLLVRAFGAGGTALEGGIDEVLKVSLDAEGYDRAMKYGLVYSTVIPVAKSGPYQIRAALLDQASGKIGTANQFLMVPRQPGHGFLVSGVVLPQMMTKENDITPASGPASFAPGQAVPFAFEVIGGAGEKALLVSTLLYRDGELVKRTAFRPLQPSGRTLHGSLFAKSEIAIPEGAPVGDYRLQVVVSEGASAPAGRVASQWVDLAISNSR